MTLLHTTYTCTELDISVIFLGHLSILYAFYNKTVLDKRLTFSTLYWDVLTDNSCHYTYLLHLLLSEIE